MTTNRTNIAVPQPLHRQLKRVKANEMLKDDTTTAPSYADVLETLIQLYSQHHDDFEAEL